MTDPRDDDNLDPHLRQALRHAPDAQLEAPPALGDFILKEARAKARDPKPASPPSRGWAAQTWDWLARPAVATGFAGVMAATLVGLMWWDQPMDEALPRSPVPAAAPAPATAEIASAPGVTTPSAAADAIKPPEPAPLREAAAPRARELARKPAPVAGPAPAREEPAAAKKDDARADMAQRNTPKAAEQATVPPPVATSPAPATAAAPAPAPVAPAAPPPAPAAAHYAPAPVTADTAPAGAAAAKSEEQKLKRSATPADASPRTAGARIQLNESRRQAEAEAYTRVASVRAAIAAEPARWTWQRGGSTAQPMNDAIYAWLAQLDAAANTRWQARTARETAAPIGRELTLLRDGQVMHRWQFTDAGVLWDRGQSAWQIDLPPDQLAPLRSTLDTAAP
ncbi:MAG: hypothetical protein ABW190_08400 [Rhizobacter sp.]